MMLWPAASTSVIFCSRFCLGLRKRLKLFRSFLKTKHTIFTDSNSPSSSTVKGGKVCSNGIVNADSLALRRILFAPGFTEKDCMIFLVHETSGSLTIDNESIEFNGDSSAAIEFVRLACLIIDRNEEDSHSSHSCHLVFVVDTYS